MITPELARAALVFLGRTDIKGAEAQTFMQVAAALDALANPKPAPKPAAKQ